MLAGVGRLLIGGEPETSDDGNFCTGFVIAHRRVLTVAHCVRDTDDGMLSLRLPAEPADSGLAGRRHVFVPLRVVEMDEALDGAVLNIDIERLSSSGWDSDQLDAYLDRVAVPLSVQVSVGLRVRTEGFPASNANPDGMAFGGTIEDPHARLPTAPALQLHLRPLGAASPETPKGHSGGPVIVETGYATGNADEPVGGPVAVGLVRAYPRGDDHGWTALGGTVYATRIDDLARRFPAVAEALAHEAQRRFWLPILTRDHQLSPVAEPRRIWMAPPVDRMIERPELGVRLIAALTERGAGNVGLTTGLAGVGGFGKTTLAAWACRQPEIRRRFPGGLLWVTIGQKLYGADLAEKINDLAFALCGQRHAISDPDVAGAELGRLLDGSEPALLIIDDVWDEQQLRPFRFGGGGCTRLITTRVRGLLPPDGPRIRVDAMSQDQAQQLITDGVTGLPATASKQLAVVAGRWPVLLSLVNGVLRRRVEWGQQPVEAAAEIVGKLAVVGPAAFDPTRPADRNRAVAATVEASLVLLDPADQDRYLDLAIYPEGVDIPLDALRLLWPPGLVDTLCEELTGLGLVAEYRLDPPEPRLVLHDVMRAYLRSCRDAIDRMEVHRRLITTAASLLPPHEPTRQKPWWLLPANASYLWRFVPYHLREAGASEEAITLACDLRWIVAKARRIGSVVGALADLDLAEASIASRSQPAFAQRGNNENPDLVDAGDAAIVRGDVIASLRRLIEQSAHLLRSSDPQGVLEATLASRAVGVACLADATALLASTLARPYLMADQPLPDKADPSLYRVLISDGEPVTTVRFSPDGGMVASAGVDGIIRLWDAFSGNRQHILVGHLNWITHIAFNASGDLLASAGEDGSVRLWNIVSGSLLHTLVGHRTEVTAVAFHPSGQLVASTGADGAVRLWEITSGDATRTLTGHSATVWDVVFSPNGQMIASASADATIRLWSVHDGRLRHILVGHGGSVNSVAFSPDSSTLISGARDGSLRIWDVAIGKLRHSLPGHVNWVRSVCFSSSGRFAASASWDRSARLWDVSTGKCLRVFDNHLLSAETITFRPDESILASAAGDGTIYIWDSSTGEKRFTLNGHTKSVPTIAFSPGGGYLVSGSWDGSVRLWRLTSADGKYVSRGVVDVVSSPNGPVMTSVACSSDGRFLATSGRDGVVYLYTEGSKPRSLAHSIHGKPVHTIAFSPDGRLVASGGADGVVAVWSTGPEIAARRLAGHAVAVRAVSFSPDGNRLLSAGDDGVLRIWHAASGRIVVTWSGHAERIMAVAWSRDGRTVATAGDDGIVRMQDTVTGSVVKNLATFAVTANAVAFDAAGTRLAAGGTDGVLRLWNLTTGECHSLAGHELTIEAVAFRSDGAYVASAGCDGTVRLWVPSTGDFVAAIRVDDSLSGVAWTPDRRSLVAIGNRGMYRLTCVGGSDPVPLG